MRYGSSTPFAGHFCQVPGGNPTVEQGIKRGVERADGGPLGEIEFGRRT